ncbi:RidA family protein [Pedobacter psychrodurus]|uniref:RidA family protein n=1 Tax=Pedobacter psychrodurus TaxID=2530456 RepID=A0A4R0Q1B3_9SPHI|nr:Rid family hydrolase [Pedobacter psychrodurus]TCD28766.1 RidA family protein [Pedobacter psychrodurus]
MEYIYSAQSCWAKRTGNLLYCSGLTPIDPAPMQIEAITIGEQRKRAIDNLDIALQAGGLTLINVVKNQCFYSGYGLFSQMNATYTACFGGHRPASSTMAVKGLSHDAMVEIACIAQYN